MNDVAPGPWRRSAETGLPSPVTTSDREPGRISLSRNAGAGIRVRVEPAGDRAPEILLREAAHVHRLARAIVRDAQAAEDVAQDTLLVALRRPPHGDGDPHRLRAWLA